MVQVERYYTENRIETLIITSKTHVMVSMVWLTQIVEFIQSVEFSTPQQYNSACIKLNPSNIGGEIAKININIDFATPNMFIWPKYYKHSEFLSYHTG